MVLLGVWKALVEGGCEGTMPDLLRFRGSYKMVCLEFFFLVVLSCICC